MNRRGFVITSFLYFIQSLVGLFSFFSLANERKRQKNQITFTTYLPDKMSKSEYEFFKGAYLNKKKDKALFNKYKKTIYKEQYAFTGTQSAWTLTFENKKSLTAFRDELKSLLNINRVSITNKYLLPSKVELTIT